MSLRKTIGAVKDQTSIGIAKVSSTISPELEVAIVKATSHDNEPANEKYFREILNLTNYTSGYVSSCVSIISRRLSKTRDWVVALKTLMLVQKLLVDGNPVFQQELLYATRRGTRLLNMSDFRDEAHSNSWDHSAFVRTYALYLDQRLECIAYERKQGEIGRLSSVGSRDGGWKSPGQSDFREYDYHGGEGSSRSGYDRRSLYRDGEPREQKEPTPTRDMKSERVLGRMYKLQQLLDRFLACRPTGNAKSSRLVFVALYPIVRESFQLHVDIGELLAVLLDRYFDMDYPDCVKTFEVYSTAAKQINELTTFYSWCKDVGVARSSEYPEVQKITDKLLETLEEFMRDRAKRPKTPEQKHEDTQSKEPEPVEDMNSIKALPAPEDFKESPPRPQPVTTPPPPQETAVLVDLRDDGVTADAQGNKLALALFSDGGATTNGTGSWEPFPSTNGEPQVTSAWQTPAAEQGKADWELALVEVASNLSKQKATMGGGLDPLLLNGMYDQGAVTHHVNSQNSGGSASSVALPGPGQSTSKVLALPAPDGTVQTVGQDPFAASLSIPPPSFVQMADMEKKQHFVVHEQMLWQQYARDGMQGQVGLSKIQGIGHYHSQPVMPYGMPPVNGIYYPPPVSGVQYNTPHM